MDLNRKYRGSYAEISKRFQENGEIDLNQSIADAVLDRAGYRENPGYPRSHCFTLCKCMKCGEMYEAGYEHICRRKNSWPASEEENQSFNVSQTMFLTKNGETVPLIPCGAKIYYVTFPYDEIIETEIVMSQISYGNITYLDKDGNYWDHNELGRTFYISRFSAERSILEKQLDKYTF